MFAGTHRHRRVGIVVGAPADGILRKAWTAAGGRRAPPRIGRRIDRVVQRSCPAAVPDRVADRWRDQQIARARRGDVRDANALGLVARHFARFVRRQLDWRPSAEAQIADVVRTIDQTIGALAAQFRRHVGENDDREFQSFRLVHRHQPNAVAPLFENRRLGRLAAVCLIAELLDEAAERHAAVHFVLSRQLGDVEHVSQRLLPRRSEHERDVCPCRIEQLRDRVGDGPVIPAAVQPAQPAQRVGNRTPFGRNVLGYAKRMQRTVSLAVVDQRFVVDREKRPTQRRIHRQLVVRPLDGRERRAHRFHFFAIVKRLAAHEQVRHAAGFERLHVRPRHVFAKMQKAAEQQAHMARLDPYCNWHFVADGALRHLPVARRQQPVNERTDCGGQRFFNRVAGDAPLAVRLGHRQRDDGRLTG